MALIICISLGFLNGYYLPMTQARAREIMDRYVQSIPIVDLEERQYKGNILIKPLTTNIENLHITAGSGKWLKTTYSDIILDVALIEFAPTLLLWKGKQNITAIKNINFQAGMSFDEIERIIIENNQNLSKATLWFDGGHVFIQAYFELLKSSFEFDGELILTPNGELKYQIRNVVNEDGEMVRSKQVLSLIDDNLNFLIPVRIMDQTILLDELDVSEDGIKIKGKSENPALTEA
jgi:hypothetical protein